MAERKYPKSMAASLLNKRQQRILELKLADIEQMWYAQLKLLARERLDVIRQISKYFKLQQSIEHLTDDMTVEQLRSYADRTLAQVRDIHSKKMDKFDFEKNEVDTIPLHLPSPEDDVDDAYGVALKTLSHIVSFASSWSLASTSSDTNKSTSEQRQGLMTTLNRSLGNKTSLQSFTTLDTRGRMKRRREFRNTPLLSMVDLSHLPTLNQVLRPKAGRRRVLGQNPISVSEPSIMPIARTSARQAVTTPRTSTLPIIESNRLSPIKETSNLSSAKGTVAEPTKYPDINLTKRIKNSNTVDTTNVEPTPAVQQGHSDIKLTKRKPNPYLIFPGIY